jgi:hypothetical protein
VQLSGAPPALDDTEGVELSLHAKRRTAIAEANAAVRRAWRIVPSL